MMLDARWRRNVIIPTLVIQIILAIVALAVSIPGEIVLGVSVYTLRPACSALLCGIVELICYLCGVLHPLVALVFAIEFMVIWIFTTVYSILFYVLIGKGLCEAGAPAGGLTTDYFGESSYGAWIAKSDCQKMIAMIVLSVLNL